MRYLFVVLFLFFLCSNLSIAHPVEEQEAYPSPRLQSFFNRHIKTSSLQFAIYSYKPKLGDLNNVLQSVGITKTPVAMMPTLSIVFQHMSELDSRLEIGYWRTELQTPGPNSLFITTTLVPISYQLIYRPVFLYEYLPIYFGAGVGLLSANFEGNMIDLLAEQGIMLSNGGTSTTGYVLVGLELFQWQTSSNTRASIGNNAAITFELKRLLKSVETTGTPPINIILDGTAIGFGVSTQF